VKKIANKDTANHQNDTDSALFRDAIGDIRPLAKSNRHYQQPKSPEPGLLSQKLQKNALSTELTNMAIDAEQSEHFLQAGLQKSVLRKLRRGHYPVEDQLDLHNLNQQQASKVIIEFIDFASSNSMSCIKIIHGKGLGSINRKPVLKSLTRNILSRHPQVQAYTPARDSAGGSGAVLVLLKTTS